MYLVDFIYDDLRLSDLGCMVGYMVTSNSDSVEMGSVITFDTIKNNASYLTEIVNAKYDEVYTCTFDIFRQPCENYENTFTDQEVTWFMRWLNRKEYNKFIPIYNDDNSFYKFYMMGTFGTVQAIKSNGHVVGFTLTFTANAPFGYLDYSPTVFDVIAGNGFTLNNESEELGIIYPRKFTIYCEKSGTLTISNSMEPGRVTEIKNCIAGETITFDCIHRVITSDKTHSGLYNDFNYIYPRLKNTIKSKVNTFTSSISGTVTIDYHPVRKVGVIV